MIDSRKAKFLQITAIRLFLPLLLIVGTASGRTILAAAPLDAFLSRYCIHCHGPDQQESELRIDMLSRDFKSGGEAHRWAELIERVNSGEMPPEGEPRPTQDEIADFVTQLERG